MCNTILFCLFNIYIFARLGSRVGENILHTLCETSAKWVKVKESHYKCLMRYSFILDIDFPQAENQDPKFWLIFFHCDICMLSDSIFQTHFIALNISEKSRKSENEGLIGPHPKPSTNQHWASCGIFISGNKKQTKKKKQEEEKGHFDTGLLCIL